MTKNSREKLADYLEGFNSLSYDGITPIGAVLADDKNHKETATELKKSGFAGISDNDLELKLSGIAENLEAGEKIFISLSAQMPVKVFNFFLNIARGKIPNAKVLLVMPEKLYDNHALFDRIVSSVCRI